MRFFLLYIPVVVFLFAGFTYPANKLIEPQALVELLKKKSDQRPMILNVGPSPNIPGALVIGNVADPENKTRMNTVLKNLPKSKEIVIYCGCCKLEDCWNIHEADKLLTGAHFTNYKILNLPTDFYQDWKDKGFPVE